MLPVGVGSFCVPAPAVMRPQPAAAEAKSRPPTVKILDFEKDPFISGIKLNLFSHAADIYTRSLK
jgi:hypothetical protein